MRPRIRLSFDAAGGMVNAARAALPNETGGILIGYHEGPDIVVTQALVIPPQKRIGNRYTRSASAANAALSEFLQERDPADPAGYVGEWHTHPGPASPSSMDKAAIAEIAKDARNSLAMLVVSGHGRSPMSALIATRSRLLRAQFAQARPDREVKKTHAKPANASRGKQNE